MSQQKSKAKLSSSVPFTLTELLIIMAIISILLGLSLSGISIARNRANQTTCSNNLKQCGSISQMFADEHEGNFLLQDDTQTPSVSWAEAMEEPGYLKNREILVCPSAAPYKFQENNSERYRQIYGARSWWNTPAEYVIFYDSDEDGASQSCIAYKKIKEPSKHIHFADSVLLGNNKQYFKFHLAQGTEGFSDLIQMRHSQRAVCWFVDGHVSDCAGPRLKEFGIRDAADKNGNKVSLR